MTTAQTATRTRVVNCRADRYDVLIDRSTPLGNPYLIGRDGDRDQVIAAYARYVTARPDLMAMLPALRGRVLGCHCKPLPCHGDVLAALADATRFLPPGARCTAYWYAQQARMLPYGGPADPDDLEFLRQLGWRAACLAYWHGIPPWRVAEGPYRVHQWPEWVWSAAADAMAWHAAEHGDYGGDPARESADGDPEGYGDPAWGGRGPSGSYREWRDEGYGDPVHPHGYWEAGDYDDVNWGSSPYEDRDAGWGPGQAPWDGDDIRPY